MFEFIGHIVGDTIYIEIRYNGVVIDTKLFSSDFNPSINGIEYHGIDGAIQTIKSDINRYQNYTTSNPFMIYPFTGYYDGTYNSSISGITSSNNTTSNFSIDAIARSGSTSGTTIISGVTSGITGNTISLGTDELTKIIDGIKNDMIILQGLGLSAIKDVTTILWNTIEPLLLTKRQTAKKVLLISNPLMTEEDAQLFIYGKLYYKNGILYDNDILDPSCVSKPTDDNYHKPIDDSHPISKQIDKWIKELKDSLIQLGIKLGEFIDLIADTTVTIALALTSLVSSVIILPFGAGMPTALTAVKTMMMAIKTLKSKIGEIFPFLASFDIIGYLLPMTFLVGIIATITGILAIIKSITDSITSIFAILAVIIALFNKIKKRSDNVQFKITATANPDHVKINQIAILSVTANGGDYNYTFEWTDSYGNIIANDPNLDYDDGTRTLTPYIPYISKTLITPLIEISNYTVKVTDGTGKIATSTVKISRD